ncbi:hypothetical protein RQP46_000303 [Phenoliferia psychrophenolica]
MMQAKAKVDISSFSEQEKKLFSLYGKVPPAKKSLLAGKLQERKYFDSGDYALSKADSSHKVGTAIPSPDSIPHPSPMSMSTSPTSNTLSSSPPGPGLRRNTLTVVEF